MAVTTLRAEVTELLQELIRVDTVNPPGNETAAAELLREYLEANGVQCELYAKVPGRANLVARIPSSGDGPRLALLSHTDTVLADASEWDRDPWSGDVHEGEVWGRGALDMKGEVAAKAVAIASLARDGFEPRGDLVFVAAADEEVNDGFGLSWLCVVAQILLDALLRQPAVAILVQQARRRRHHRAGAIEIDGAAFHDDARVEDRQLQLFGDPRRHRIAHPMADTCRPTR